MSSREQNTYAHTHTYTEPQVQIGPDRAYDASIAAAITSLQQLKRWRYTMQMKKLYISLQMNK